MFYKILKIIFDKFFALTILIFFSPLIIIIAIITRIKMGKGVFFKQFRPGLHGKAFKMYKFRTMTQEYDKNGKLLPEKNRITPFGNFLRSTSLDELPEFINVLKGEMSIVGPRPLLMKYLPRYKPWQMRRHDVKPGITGWAQIMGRNAISWDEKFKFDIWYVENRSFSLDLKIIVLTIIKVIKRADINQKEHISMQEFKG